MEPRFLRPALLLACLAAAVAGSQACFVAIEPFPEGPDATGSSALDGSSTGGEDGSSPPGPDAGSAGRDAASAGLDARPPPGPDAAQPAGSDAGSPAGPDASTGACSGHGTLRTWGAVQVCECDPGFSGDPDAPTSCVATSSLCKGGAFAYDWNDDGTAEPSFEPTADECEMYEVVNRTRASHDPEGTPECHEPLRFSVEWSAHGRNHSKKMSDRGGLFHDDYPMAQNCAYGCGPACEMNMYMTGANEGHCSPLSHHCNIMRCGTSAIGIGYWPMNGGNWNTQNIF
ncbi:MAG TPA: hypothetical protein VGK67_24940 [Myxococcales bacterium]|jgi:hypothetical protein